MCECETEREKGERDNRFRGNMNKLEGVVLKKKKKIVVYYYEKNNVINKK